MSQWNEKSAIPSSKPSGRRTADDGQSMLEMALMLPLLLLLMLGIVEVGRAIYYTIAVNNSATAGVEFGSQSSITASNDSGMQDAVTKDANIPASFPPMTVVTSHGCACDTGSGTSCTYPIPPASNCDPTFACSGTVVECVQVTTQLSINSLFNYPGLPSTYQANGKAVMRVRN